MTEKIFIKEEKEVPTASLAKKKFPSSWLKADGQLVVDVFQTDFKLILQSSIAGVGIEDIEVSIEDGMLIIKGERKTPPRDKIKKYYFKECYWGPFSRQIVLPENIDASAVQATLKRGILTLEIPLLASKADKQTIEVSQQS